MGSAPTATGKEIQELLLKVVDGIYIGKSFEHFIEKEAISIVDGALKLARDDGSIATIPINENKSYPLQWINNEYFDYVIEAFGALIAFNIKEKSGNLTIDQFKSLINAEDSNQIHNRIPYNIESSDYCAIRMKMKSCSLIFEVDNIIIRTNTGEEIAININDDMWITNMTSECGHVCYALEFGDNLTDIVITPSFSKER